MCGDYFILMKIQQTIDRYITRIRQVAALLGYGDHKFWKFLGTLFHLDFIEFFSQ